MEKVDLLLINPWIYDFAAYDLWAKPLGLLYIASMLKDYGYSIKFIDCLYRAHPKLNYYKEENYGCGHYYSEEIPKPPLYKNIPRKYKRYGLPYHIVEEELFQLQAKYKIKAVLVTSMMTYWYLGVFDIIKLIRKYFKDTPIILGGIYATLCYEHATEKAGADIVIRGRDEKEILKEIDNICNVKRDYKDFYKSQDEHPYPSYELFPLNKYICLLTSMGCIYDCNYCAVKFLSGNKFYQRAPLKVVDEIEFFYKNMQVKDFVFYDDLLLANAKEHICVILEEVLSRGIKCNFHTPNGLSVREIKKDVAKLLYRAGFKTIRLSFESSAIAWQKSTGKNLPPTALDEAVANLKEAGYNNKEIEVYIMTGMPNQNFLEIKESLEYVHKLGAKIKLVEYSLTPHTAIWQQYKDEDPLLHNNSILRFQKYAEYKALKELAKSLNENI